MTTINWLANEELSLEEFLSLIPKYKPKMESMEMKNQWDLRINDTEFWWFVDMFFSYIADEVPEVKYYPKIDSFIALWHLCTDTREYDEKYRQTLIDNHNLNICGVVIEWITNKAKELLKSKYNS